MLANINKMNENEKLKRDIEKLESRIEELERSLELNWKLDKMQVNKFEELAIKCGIDII